MKLLFVISSKSPNRLLYECVQAVEKYVHPTTICIIDSDSSDRTEYERVHTAFPAVQIHYVQNRNYEFGAWKSALSLYPDYDVYACIQDSLILQRPLSIDEHSVYTFHNNTGYKGDINCYLKGVQNIWMNKFPYIPHANEEFCIAQHSCFIVPRQILIDIYNTMHAPPVNKDGSCFYERNFGLYFIVRNIQTIDLQSYFLKVHLGRM